ncbi:UNVERIFIED_CONTAM: hypothetical protein HDU68_008851 [Siphonaria sp. JEL0065]|nr:hypothetical protein HDU68_008851 [Siphonaria sp. JEL0065]
MSSVAALSNSTVSSNGSHHTATQYHHQQYNQQPQPVPNQQQPIQQQPIQQQPVPLSSTTLQVSVKQRNGSIATITPTPAKVTRGFSCSLNSNGSETSGSVNGGSYGSPHNNNLFGKNSYDGNRDAHVNYMSPSQMSPSSNNFGGTSYNTSSSRNSFRSLADTGVFGSGESNNAGGVMTTRRIYSNASSSSASSLQTFFGIGEGQALKERLRKEAEMKEQYFQQLMLLEQQQIRQQQQQQQTQARRNSHRDLHIASRGNSSVSVRIDSKEHMSGSCSSGKGDCADENTAGSSNVSSAGDRKASFAIGLDEEDEYSEDDENDPDTLQAVPTRKSSREFSKGASMRSSRSSEHKQGNGVVKRASPDMLTPESSVGGGGIAPSVRTSLEKASNSPLLPRRTFPSAPYLPLYNQPKAVSSFKSPISVATKLLLNPNPNSSSAAEIPVLSANTAPSLNSINDTTASATAVDSAVPPPIPITRTISHKKESNNPNGANAALQPPELQAPLHQTPTANATSEADIQAAAAAARARGQNLPRTIPEFYKRLQDLRNHNIQQLVALRDQISLLKSRKNNGNSIVEGHGMEYYEREMGRVVELARRDEGYLVEFGRRGMGIDVNTLSLMLSNLPTFDPNEPVKRGHQDQYPHTQDHIRRTKSFVNMSNFNSQTQHQQQPHVQQQQPLQRTHSSQRIAVVVPEYHVAPAATPYPVIPRTRSHARVVDMNTLAQQQQQPQQHNQYQPALQQRTPSVAVAPQPAAVANAQQVEYLQMQYNTQMNHIVTKPPPPQIQHQQHQAPEQVYAQQYLQPQQVQPQYQQQPQLEPKQPRGPPPVLQERFSSTAAEAGGPPSELPSAIFSTVAQFSGVGEYEDDDEDDEEGVDNEDYDELEEHNVEYADKDNVADIAEVQPVMGAGLGVLSGGGGSR